MAVMRPENDFPPPPDGRKLARFIALTVLVICATALGHAILQGWNPFPTRIATNATPSPTPNSVPFVVEPTEAPTEIPTIAPSPTLAPSPTIPPTPTPKAISVLEFVEDHWIVDVPGAEYADIADKNNAVIRVYPTGEDIGIAHTFLLTETVVIDAKHQQSQQINSFQWSYELHEQDVVLYIYRLTTERTCRSVPIYASYQLPNNNWELRRLILEDKNGNPRTWLPIDCPPK